MCPYMSYVNINIQTVNFEFTQANTFATKPISMMDFMYISVE